MLLNVYSIKNLHSGLRVCQVGACMCVCVYTCVCWTGVGSLRPLSSLGLEGGRPVIGAASRQGGGHMGGVTSRQRYVNPLMGRDEVRLPNPRKTKVLSVRLDKSSTAVAVAAAAAPPAAWENLTRPGPRRTCSGPLMGY